MDEQRQQLLRPEEVSLDVRKPRRRYGRGPGNLILRIIASVYLWIALPLSFLFSFITQVLLWILLFPLFLASPRWRLLILGGLFRFFQVAAAFYLNPFWSLKVVKKPPPNFQPSGDFLLMCNHLTGADPWIISRALFPWEFKWVYKAELHKVPVAGCVLRLAGDLPLFFTKDQGGWGTKPGSVKALMDRVEYLGEKHNIGVAIFPEGTRSRTGRLQLFKDGFFRFALEHERSILPCVAHNNSSLWPLGSILFGVGTVYFMFGEPVHPEEGETVDSLKERVRSQMIELLKLSPVYDPELDEPMTELSSTRGQGLTGCAK